MLREVKTNYGVVRGLPAADPRITSFKGIPFAAPPVGENRWRAPQPPKAWDGVLEAYKFGPISVQDRPAMGTDIYCREWHVDKDVVMDEDCLYLNIWTPAKSADEKLPVLVWYFGGGLQWGYPSEMEFDGERLARRGIIVVSVNYRLNVFGFLGHEEMTKENPDKPTNFGYQDQQAGTRWVYENIAAFGGDPENITIAGQSAGGGSVMAQITNLDNKDMIKRAIVMSGIIGSPYLEAGFPDPMNLEQAHAYGKEFFDSLGVKNLKEARELPSDVVLAGYNKFIQNHPRLFGTRDDKYLFGDQLNVAMEGHVLDIPIMAGNTVDEFLNSIRAESEEDMYEKAKKLFGKDADTFVKFEEAKKCDGNAYGKVSGIELSDKILFESLRKNGSKQNFYYYRFAPDIPGWDNPGCFHSVDLWFFFETLAKCWRPFTGHHYDLARHMANYWANFIKTGDPNGNDADGTPMQRWVPYEKETCFEMEFTAKGCVARTEDSHEFKAFLREKMREYKVRKFRKPMQAFNPYLPADEFVPDGEPYVFGDRVYVYGSHDYYDGDVFCMGDYVGWSAPVNNLADWRYEGIIYGITDDPLNPEGKGMLYAPDVTVGPDGRYFLYYVCSHIGNVSVAVCDSPAGRYQFYGHVHYADGTLLGAKEGDEPQFDPGVLTEGDKTYLYTGFCGFGDKSRSGAMCTVLGPDMLTIVQAPKIVVPGSCYSEGSEFEGHAYFEAASIRKKDGKYIFIYSSQVMHELCYAVSDKPDDGFKYGGVLISNCDLGIDSYKKANMISNFGANNHGSAIEINGKWYIFYHHHTNGTWYSRQVCAEELPIREDGLFGQAEITSCGLNGGPLRAEGYYPAYIACNLFYPDEEWSYRDHNFAYQPNITKLKVTLDEPSGEYVVANFTNGSVIGYKYFDFKGVKRVSVYVHGYAHGTLEVRTQWDGEAVGSAELHADNYWNRIDVDVNIEDGVKPLYFTYHGTGNPLVKGFEIQ